MIKDGELSFETRLKIEFLPPNNGSKKCLEKSLYICFLYSGCYVQIETALIKKKKNWNCF